MAILAPEIMIKRTNWPQSLPGAYLSIAGADVADGDACLRCQGESKKDSYGKQDCVVVWGECNHSFHFCCMSLWVKQNNRCPLCQQEWSIQRMGK
ncbi:unnamed protein product [Colias eurytheme]|nr:unnamed protein product [Colias eurytheme]